jgi:uncharacterized protein
VRRFAARPLRALLGACCLALAAAAAAQVPAQATSPAEASCPPVPRPPDAAQLQALQRDARDHGLLWRLQRDGRTSYLFGTLHVGRLEWVAPGPQVSAALRETDTLALELDLGDPAVQREMAASLARRAQGLSLSAAQREQLRRHVEAACLPPAALAALHPLMQAMTLMLLDARWVGLDPGFGQEMVLSQVARAVGRPVVSLESVAIQVSTLIPDDPRHALAQFDQVMLHLEGRRGRAVTQRLATAWAAGQLGELENYEAWCECVDSPQDREFMRRVNDERNPAIAGAIVARHAQGQRLFAAVGALHMTGPNALPRLLQQRGFRVERVEFAR